MAYRGEGLKTKETGGGSVGHRRTPPPFMVCRFHGRRCLQVSKEKWKEPGKGTLAVREAGKALEMGLGI